MLVKDTLIWGFSLFSGSGVLAQMTAGDSMPSFAEKITFGGAFMVLLWFLLSRTTKSMDDLKAGQERQTRAILRLSRAIERQTNIRVNEEEDEDKQL